jgi:hypothetical protein
MAAYGQDDTLEAKTLARLEQLRAVQAGQSAEVNDAYNEQMNATWELFSTHKEEVLPILRSRLRAEIARQVPSDLILLDVGFFVYLNDGAEGKEVSLDALTRLNLESPLVLANHQELFHFVHKAAQDHAVRVLPVIERAFLRSEEEIVVPEHALILDGSRACVFLYGAYGPESEGLLRTKLADPSLARRVLEILSWLGSPDSLPEVRTALNASPDDETFARVASYMMRSAGPAGRDALLGLAAEGLNPGVRPSLGKIQAEARGTSFESIRASFADFPGDRGLSETEVTARMAAMIENFGVDDRTSPIVYLDSGLSPERLITDLSTVRSRRLFSVSDEVLGDVEITNLLINGLRYKAALPAKEK